MVVSAGNINLTNAGTIRGDGTSTGTSTAFEGGIRLQAGTNTIANSGTISGAQFGIVTTQLFNTAKGVYKGRPKSIDPAEVRQLHATGLGPTEIAKKLGIGRASVYRALGG